MFKEQDITGRILITLDSQALKELGIILLKNRGEILESIAMMKEYSKLEKWDEENIKVWLIRIGFERFVPTFRREELTGAELITISKNKIGQMGVVMDADKKYFFQELDKLYPSEERVRIKRVKQKSIEKTTRAKIGHGSIRQKPQQIPTNNTQSQVYSAAPVNYANQNPFSNQSGYSQQAYGAANTQYSNTQYQPNITGQYNTNASYPYY